MNELMQNLVAGLMISISYAFVGVGLTLIYGVSRIMDFAQGAYLILGAFLGFALVSAGLPYLVAIPVVLLMVFLLAYGIHAAVLARMEAREPLVVFVVTLGLGLLIQVLIVKIVSAEPQIVPSPFNKPLKIGGITLMQQHLLIFAVCIPVFLGFAYLFRYTNAGRAMRSVAENRDVSALLGLDVTRVVRLVYSSASAIAGLAGVLLGAVYAFNAFDGSTFLMKGFAVALAGGLGSVVGAVTMGLVLGIGETLMTAYPPDLGFISIGPEFRDGWAFLLMIVILSVRPQGVFRGSAIEA